jgi:hypothetical protein
LPLVTKEGYIKIEPAEVLDTRALPRRDEVEKLNRKNLSEDNATWEDKLFIKTTFPDFYQQTITRWWPTEASRGQEAAQEGGGAVVMTQLLRLADHEREHKDGPDGGIPFHQIQRLPCSGRFYFYLCR